jgi:ABC-type Fe3+/spermidine/putrescine transport system ATPase subunit
MDGAPPSERDATAVPPATIPAVALDAVSKSYDGRLVVSDVSLSVARGDFLAILGPSGSGKTTVMRLIGGFETPDRGRILIDGADVTDLPPERRRVNTVFQSYALFPHLSVLDNVAYGPRMQGLSRAERRKKAGAMLDLVRLTDAAALKPHQLSGGMQQRVALARALAADPAVLLLDEPLAALDRKLRDEMQRELRRVQSELGATFIYVTHDQEEAFGMADRLAVMRAGRFVQEGPPAEVYDRPADAWVALFVGSANTVPARFLRPGSPAEFASDFGPVAAGFADPALAAGDAALVVVRPEATRFLPASDGEPAPNRIAARLVDSVAIGPSLRLRAVTDGGGPFESIIARSAATTPALVPGDAVLVTFDAEAARAYPAPDVRGLRG